MWALNGEALGSGGETVAPTEYPSGATTKPASTQVNDQAVKRWVGSDHSLIDAGSSFDALDKGKYYFRQLTVPIHRQVNQTRELEIPPRDLGIIKYPISLRPIPREVVLQEWEGQVQSIEGRTFSARLVDLTRGMKEETEEADLPVDDVIEADRELIVPGAIFRWLICYRWADGDKERFARIVMRRLPMWTEREIKAADKRAEELHFALFGDAGERAAKTGSD